MVALRIHAKVDPCVVSAHSVVLPTNASHTTSRRDALNEGNVPEDPDSMIYHRVHQRDPSTQSKRNCTHCASNPVLLEAGVEVQVSNRYRTRALPEQRNLLESIQSSLTTPKHGV